jgi:hypothetical protein
MDGSLTTECPGAAGTAPGLDTDPKEVDAMPEPIPLGVGHGITLA